MSKRQLDPAERLIVAVDLKLTAGVSFHHELFRLVELIADTGVCIKLNSALRQYGYQLIPEIQAHGVAVFADLKLCDIGETLIADALHLQKMAPETVTVMATSGGDALTRFSELLVPRTEVLAVTVLSTLTNHDTQALYGARVDLAVKRTALEVCGTGISGFVCTPSEVGMLRELFDDSLVRVTPGIRPSWAEVLGDDQNRQRTMTPGDAIRAGADRIIVGRPILQAKNPRDAIMRTIDEIAEAMT